MESFDEDLSLAIFRDLSLGNARPACAGRLRLSLGICRLGTSVGTFAGVHPLEIFALELSFANVRMTAGA